MRIWMFVKIAEVIGGQGQAGGFGNKAKLVCSWDHLKGELTLLDCETSATISE